MSQRTKFILLLLIFAVPTLASFVVFYFFPAGKSGNYGELIVPVILMPDVPMKKVDQTPDDIAQRIKGKWVVLTRDGGDCELACQKKLFAMRQSRLILGREQERVVRVILVDDAKVPSAQRFSEYDGTIWIDATNHPWLSKLPATEGKEARAYIYVVDPMRNLFIRYSADPDIKLMAKDLLKVLKASQIG